MSGGYAEQISDTVEIHCNTIRAVRAIFNPVQNVKSNVEGQSLDFGL